MQTIKQLVLAYLRHDRSFATGARLYNQYGKNNAFKQQVNQRLANGTADKLIHSMVNDELADLAGISTHVMLNYLNQPLVPIARDSQAQEAAAPAVAPPAPPQKSRAEELESLKVALILEQLLKLKPEFKKTRERKDVLIKLLIEAEAAAEASMKKPEGAKIISVADIPQPVKEAMKLREEFPFLQERDCPPVLKALVGTKLETYDKFRFAHEDLFTAESFKDQQEAALAVIDNYLENQVIYEELKHYRDNKVLLGTHPDVRAELDRLEVEALSALDLSKERSNLQKSISKYKNQVAEEVAKGEAGDADKITNWEALIATKSARMALVEARLETLK